MLRPAPFPVSRLSLLFACLALAACAGPGLPATETLPAELATAATARFLDARAVAADASGRLYVVDAGAAHVVVFAPDGRAEAVFGGPGTADESLVEPVAVDPTNGQAVYVADAATGRVVRFTESRRAAEAIPVPATAAVGDALATRRDAARGQPVGVAAVPGGLLVVAEARRGVLLVLDAGRRVERALGLAAADRPEALAADDRGNLVVLAAGRVLTFDAFGAPGPDLDASGIGTLLNVAVSGPLTLVAGETGVAVFRAGARVATVASPVPLVGATVANGRLWGLGRYALVDLGMVE